MPVVSPRPKTNDTPTRAASTRAWRGLLSIACLLLAGLFFFKALPSAWFSPASHPEPSATLACSADQQPRYVTSSIEELRKGDFVLAMNPETVELEERRIVDIFQRTTYHLRILELQDQAGTVQRLETTDEHPFWVAAERDFVAAGELQVGDQFVGPAGELQALVATDREEHPEGVAVYNFEVEDAHTYFVRAHGLRAPPVLVHNATEGLCAPKGRAGLKRGPKTDVDAPHNATIRTHGDLLEAGGNKVIAGGGRLPEKLIDTAGGMKGGRRPDILFETSKGQIRGRNVGKTDRFGNPIKRELEALRDLNGPGGIPTDFVPYD